MPLVIEVAAGIVLGGLALAYLPLILAAVMGVARWALLLAVVVALCVFGDRYPVVWVPVAVVIIGRAAYGFYLFVRDAYEGYRGIDSRSDV